jgi:hypothetical protein
MIIPGVVRVYIKSLRRSRTMTLKNTILAIILVAIIAIIAGLGLGIVKAEVMGTNVEDLNRVASTSANLPDPLVGLDYLEARALVLDRVGDLRVSVQALGLDTLQTREASRLLKV